MQPTTASPRGLFLLEMGKTLGYDAMTFGAGDAALGADLFHSLAADSSFPLVSANLQDVARNAPLMRPSRVVDRKGVRIGITAVTVATEAEAARLAEVGVRADDAKDALGKVLPRLRRESDVVILLARMSLKEAKALVEGFPDLVDVVVIGALEPGRGLVFRENGGAVFLTAGDRGQSLGRARMKLDGKRRPSSLVGDEILLLSSVPESEPVLDMVNEFQNNLNEMLKVEAVKTAQGRAAPDGTYYIGATACGSCHRSEHEVWAETAHSHAFQTLVDARSEALPECFRCHVTGADDPAGYSPGMSEPTALQNVQCEVCHGKGSHHSRDGTWGSSLKRQVCARCHDAANSPDFDLDVYWRMIEH